MSWLQTHLTMILSVWGTVWAIASASGRSSSTSSRRSASCWRRRSEAAAAAMLQPGSGLWYAARL